MGQALRSVRICAVTTLALAAASCTLVLDYPSSQRESSAALCSDGVDNDYNGRRDCDDLNCDGYCDEQDVVRCSDGRDNDRDGLLDANDTECWTLARPQVSRCVSREPFDFEERFDAAWSSARWYPFGALPGPTPSVAELQSAANRPPRVDRVLGFSTDAPDEGVLGGLSSRARIDGDWRSFSLRFDARLDSDGFARVALVPVALTPSDEPPTEGASTASVVVELDGHAPAALSLLAGQQRASIPWAEPDVWHTVLLVTDGTELVVSVDDKTDARLPLPSIPASRLVVWGKATSIGGSQSAVQLDDLRLQVAASRPCGVAVPQVPLGVDCRAQAARLDYDVGLSASVAEGPQGAFCAVLGSNSGHGASATGAVSWTSLDGLTWNPGGPLPSTGEQWLGSTVAFDPLAGAFRAAWVEVAGTAARMQLSTSTDCAVWSPPQEGATLPIDAEAPSYLIPGVAAPQEVYFTRPPSPGGARTLWRVRSDDGSTFPAPPERAGEFPADRLVNPPVSLVRAGSRDLIAVFPTSSGAGTSGLGMLVATGSGLDRWASVADSPILSSDPSEDEFDSSAMISGSLWWRQDHGVLLYGARGQPIPGVQLGGSLGPITVGTAPLFTGVDPSQNLPVVPGDPCGDGACQPSESCGTCAIDCGVCDGELLCADRFDSADDWTLVAPGQPGSVASQSHYVSTASARMNLAPDSPGWMVRALTEPVLGDFELTFDVHVVAPEPAATSARCTAYVGLGQLPTSTAIQPDGIFVQIDQQLSCSAGGPVLSPLVHVNGRSRSSLVQVMNPDEAKASCDGVTVGLPEAWHRVTVRRERGRVTMLVLGRDGCEVAPLGETAIDYVGAFQPLDSIVVGWGGVLGSTGWTTTCEGGTAAVSVDNLLLRSLPCPAQGTDCVEPGTGRKVCVDVQSTPEHCGTCFHPVGPAEGCNAGSPVCWETACPDSEGSTSCVDLSDSPDHCGECGRKVGEHESCRSGLRVASMVFVPRDYYVDTTEVTRAQYADWLATNPPTSSQPGECVTWNTDFTPQCGWPPNAAVDVPVVCVDWCDAYAYCAGVGKRLCGRIGGGPLNETMVKSPDANQWLAACTADGTSTYPYGSAFDPSACMSAIHPEASCVDTGGGPWCETAEVASMPGCQSSDPAYAGVFDMSGNVSEWIDACSGTTGLPDTCSMAGGNASFSTESYLACTGRWVASRAAAWSVGGFRCCAL